MEVSDAGRGGDLHLSFVSLLFCGSPGNGIQAFVHARHSLQLLMGRFF